MGGQSQASAAQQSRHDRSGAATSTFHHASARFPPSRVNVCFAESGSRPEIVQGRLGLVADVPVGDPAQPRQGRAGVVQRLSLPFQQPALAELL